MFRRVEFKNANEAFERLYREISDFGEQTNVGTKRLVNIGFYIMNPLDRRITSEARGWSLSYANREWKWYLSKNRSVEELKKYAPIWDKMHNGDNIVNSNYGYQMHRNGQLAKVAKEIIANRGTRKAWLTIYDGKEIDSYSHDTPCTLNVGFLVENGKLCMEVLMRSNDLWYGFCNDQYCFSMLQEEISKLVGIPVGWYYHFAADMHLYESNI